MSYHYSHTYTPKVPSWMGAQNSYVIPAGMGDGLGQTMEVMARQIANEVADGVVKFIRESKTDPQIFENLTAAVSRGTEPMISSVISRDVMPKVIFWGLLGLVGVGALSSFIATQTIKTRTRRNPVRRRLRLRASRRAA